MYPMSSTPVVRSSMPAPWSSPTESATLRSAWRPYRSTSSSLLCAPPPIDLRPTTKDWSTRCLTDPLRSHRERSLESPSRRSGGQRRRSEKSGTRRLTAWDWGAERLVRIAVLAPISWRVPPRHYGPWELFASLLTEGLVARGHDVTLFAAGDSETAARLCSVVPRGWSEDPGINPKVAECLHISEVFERASEFDVIHNSFDFLPLTYSGLISTPVITTIHGFSSPDILPVYAKYNHSTFFVAISDADRASRARLCGHHSSRNRHRSVRVQSGARVLSGLLRTHSPGQGSRRRDRSRKGWRGSRSG